MIELFAPSRQHSNVGTSNEVTDIDNYTKQSNDEVAVFNNDVSDFASLQLSDWLVRATKNLGYRHPTAIQKACIPAIIKGRDVLACAETGSGKTAAFVLPMLKTLAEDPYGIFAVILTPTRELAIQIAEQILALGSSIAPSVCLSVGGLDIIEQRLSLARRPHFVVATPGRFWHHLQSADPPILHRAKYLVLDEADRLLSVGFSTELQLIISKMSTKRQTLLFSATLTNTLEELETLTLKNALRFDLTKAKLQIVPSQLSQEYLFVPNRVKLCFLVAVLHKYLRIEPPSTNAHKASDSRKKKRKSSSTGVEENKRLVNKLRKKTMSSSNDNSITRNLKSDDENDDSMKGTSILIFVDTCHRCQEVSLVLQQLELNCVALHSMLPQSKRLLALHTFKSLQVPILIATDVASRGLDIQTVDLVINYDLPRIVSDYVHRVGRTARAGRKGQTLALITQHDIALLHSIEEYTGCKMTEYHQINQENILPLLGPISKAMQSAQMELLDSNFMEREQVFRKRRKLQRRERLRKSGDGNKEVNQDANHSTNECSD